MKTIKTDFETWEDSAVRQFEAGKPFEILGFDLENPRHRSFWDQMRCSGKFNSLAIPKVKAVFIPSTAD